MFCEGGGVFFFKFLIMKEFFQTGVHCIELYVLRGLNKQTSKLKPVLLFSSLFSPLLSYFLLFS